MDIGVPSMLRQAVSMMRAAAWRLPDPKELHLHPGRTFPESIGNGLVRDCV
jgi:hypothetical protein